MGTLDKAVLTILMAGRDFLLPPSGQQERHNLPWPGFIGRTSQAVEIFSRQPFRGTESVDLVAQALDRRVGALANKIGAVDCYSQIHLDLFLLAWQIDYPEIRSSPLYAETRKRAVASLGKLCSARPEYFRPRESMDNQFDKAVQNAYANAFFEAHFLEEAVRKHIRKKFQVRDFEEFSFESYCLEFFEAKQDVSPTSSFVIPEYTLSNSEYVSEKEGSSNLPASTVPENKVFSARDEVMRRHLAEAKSALTHMEQALDPERVLSGNLGRQIASLHEPIELHAPTSRSLMKLTPRSVTRSGTPGGMAVGQIFPAPKAEASELKHGNGSCVPEFRPPRQTARQASFNEDSQDSPQCELSETFLKQIAKNFSKLAAETFLVRGDEFLNILREAQVFPDDWHLETWDGLLREPERGEEWKIILAAAPSTLGTQKPIYVFPAPGCTITDTLLSLFNGCTGHGFDARINQTLLPARIRMQAGSPLTVIPPKGEVSVK